MQFETEIFSPLRMKAKKTTIDNIFVNRFSVSNRSVKIYLGIRIRQAFACVHKYTQVHKTALCLPEPPYELGTSRYYLNFFGLSPGPAVTVGDTHEQLAVSLNANLFL